MAVVVGGDAIGWQSASEPSVGAARTERALIRRCEDAAARLAQKALRPRKRALT